MRADEVEPRRASARRLVVMLGLGALLAFGWPDPPQERPPLGVRVEASASADAVARAVEAAVLLAEAERMGWVGSDPVVVRHLAEVVRFTLDAPDLDDAAAFDAGTRLGLHRTDPVVRQRLLERARRALRRVPPPSDAEVDAWYQAHGATLRAPTRLHLEHRFSRDASAAVDAPSDPLLGLRPVGWTTAARLRRDFGEAVGDAAASGQIGVWTEPVASAFGWHRLRVIERVPGEIPDLSEVRARVAASARQRAEDDAYARRLDHLLAAWDVQVQR